MYPKTLSFYYCLIITLLFSPAAKAQTIESSINLYGTKFPQEKIHIHFDKQVYMPGETVWFKAYLFEEDLPSERSTNFYAALYDEDGKMIQQQVSPILNNSTDGHFTIPGNLQTSQLICRAYTGWMLNFDTGFLYTQTLKINSNKPAIKKNDPLTANLHFFPEGGNIIEGTVNTIAFKANYSNGLPFLINAVIKKQQTGEEVIPLSVMHNGMGRFDLEFKQGDKYYAEWTNSNGTKEQTWLPDAKPAGVALKVTVQKDKLYYNLVNKTGKDSLHVLMYMYQKVFYKTNIKVPVTEPFTGVVPVNALPSGTMQLTVFDADWQPVAERVAFINNNNFLMNAAVNTPLVSTQKRGKNNIEIWVVDTVAANMSLSIIDADMYPGNAGNNIITDLLLRSDIRGYIHEPAFYFSGNNDASQKAKLDLVMLTHGWRRYNWADMNVQKMPAVNIAADEYLQVFGQVGPEVLGKLVKNEMVNLILKTKDSVNSFYTVLPDRAGYIRQRGLVFYDTARLYYTFNKSKLFNSQMSFSRSNFTLAQTGYLASFKDHLLRDNQGAGFVSGTNPLFQYHKDNNGGKNLNTEKTMQGVTLNSSNRRNWKNDPLIKLEERYVSGMFSGGALGYSLDVLHDEKAWTKFDFYAYVRNTIPGLMIGNFNLTSGRSLTYREKEVLVYIDEHEMTTSDLEALSLTQIALIKFIPNFMGRGADPGGGAINPAISVYTRKGDDLIDRSPKETDINMVKIAGYSPIKEFYSPDYSQANTGDGTDARTTLLWLPYIFTDKANRKVPITFYNNDFTKRMRIVLEGINAEGRMIHIEKIIE